MQQKSSIKSRNASPNLFGSNRNSSSEVCVVAAPAKGKNYTHIWGGQKISLTPCGISFPKKEKRNLPSTLQTKPPFICIWLELFLQEHINIGSLLQCCLILPGTSAVKKKKINLIRHLLLHIRILTNLSPESLASFL